jgi:hypothetical protein
VVLRDSEEKDENNLCFLQELRQMIVLTPQPIAKFAPLIVPCSLKLSQYKLKKKKK